MDVLRPAEELLDDDVLAPGVPDPAVVVAEALVGAVGEWRDPCFIDVYGPPVLPPWPPPRSRRPG